MSSGTQVSQPPDLPISAQQNENLILTVSCNNLINIFDNGQSAKLPVFQCNKHTMNSRISWSFYDPNLFLSGSMDRNIFLWDIRENPKQPAYQFDKKVQVKHVQFSPHDEHLFAAGYNDGQVRVWDVRKKGILHENSLQLTQTSISLDWHP